MKYNIVYADPPWDYKRKGGPKHIGTASQTYKCLKDEEIYSLNVQDITSNNCILFLWTTFPKLPVGLETIKRWGFTYKTGGFVWIKTNKVNTNTLFWGTGHYTRANAELCLLGVKGKPVIKSHGVHQVIMSPNIKHSKKPNIVRERIVTLCGNISRIELFAREKFKGWSTWGDEVNSNINLSFNKKGESIT